MDPARQSAIVGAVLGTVVALMGIVVIAIAIDAVRTAVYVPRPILALIGVGLVCAGGAFATITFYRRLAFALAIPGAALTFALPLAYSALGGVRGDCSGTLSFLGVPLATAVLGDGSCRALIACAAVLSVLVVAALAFGFWRLRR